MKKSFDGKWAMVLAALLAAAVGAVLGVTLLSGAPAEAQSRFTTCFSAIQEVVDIDDSGVVQAPPRNRSIQVPSGWTVVSAGGGASDGGRHVYVLFCR